MKHKKNNKTVIIITIIIAVMLILVLLLTSIINSLKNSEEEKKLEEIKKYSSVEDFKTIEEVAKYLDCEYIKEQSSSDSNYNIDIYMKIKVLPYTDNNSNEGYYNKLIAYITKVLKFKNFRILDEQNNVTIEVISNKEKEQITTCIINGEKNYFDKRDSKLQIKNYNQITETNFTIQSKIINQLINNNWKISDSEIGTKESTFNSYDIFFDEGIELRKINNTVFNVIFTENYKDKIVNNITTSTSKEDIIKILGEPTFEDEAINLIGYKGKKIYLFFNISNKQVSVYTTGLNNENNKFNEFYMQYKQGNLNAGEFIDLLKEKWKDYDSYEETSSYVKLQYTLRGLKIQYNLGAENGIIIYNNFNGIIYDDITMQNIIERSNELPEDMFLNNENSVFINEKERVNYIQSVKYMARMKKERIKKENEIESKLFIEDIQELEEGSYSISFISLDGKNPNSELKENINSGLWLNDKYFIYGVKQRGIYIYNAIKRNYTTVTSNGQANYEIKEYKDGILKYDDKLIKINI